jgi:hypothetical protein
MLCYHTSEMCCPYFDPIAPAGTAGGISQSGGQRAASLPLGDAWTGVCRAISETADMRDFRPVCNLGYARGECERFPAAPGPDAVRFTISDDTGARIRLHYVLERDHQPFAHGRIEYSADSQTLSPEPTDGMTGRQARAYLTAYLRRKREAARS